jgi:hypothetical protein
MAELKLPARKASTMSSFASRLAAVVAPVWRSWT